MPHKLKCWGQVFLKDKNYIERIINTIRTENFPVLEIGAGGGAITEGLIKKASFLYVVEIDRRFCKIIKDKFLPYKNIKIINCDIFKFSFSSLKCNCPFVVVGNIPYYISSRLITYLIKMRNFIKTAYLTLQKEFANKLLAKPSTRDYGFLSCLISYYAQTEKIFDIPPSAFYPKPKVFSSFLKIDFYKTLPLQSSSEDFLFSLLRQIFSFKRKKLSNALGKFYKPDLLSSLDIDFQQRPQQVSLKKYILLSDNLYKAKHLSVQ